MGNSLSRAYSKTIAGSDDTATIEIADWSELPKKPLVSIFVLSYNHEKFIAEAIGGVIMQECDFPIELVIGEDCSSDRTGEIVRDYQRRYPHLIRILTSKRNVGMHANSARCHNACRGEFIAYCEGDDYWYHPGKLQMQVDLMQANPRMSLCHTDFDRKTKFRLYRSCHRAHPTKWLARGDAYQALLMEWTVMTCTTMIRRDMWNSFSKTEFRNPDWPFGDRNLLLYASMAGLIGYIDKSTATFRKRNGSASNSGAEANLNMALGNLECITLFLTRHPTDEQTRRAALARMHHWVYKAAFRAGKLDLMEESHEWLRVNHEHHSQGLFQLHKAAVESRLPLWLMEAMRVVKDRYLSAT